MWTHFLWTHFNFNLDFQPNAFNRINNRPGYPIKKKKHPNRDIIFEKF